jgi:hypothetical protein
LTFTLTEPRMFAIPTRDVCGPHHELSLTCCIVCRKVHHTPSACVLDRTLNDCDRTSNNHLTLDFTRPFAIRLANVRQKSNQLILIHFKFFSYKYPHPHPFHLIYAHFVSKSLRESEKVFWREREREEALLVFHLQER